MRRRWLLVPLFLVVAVVAVAGGTVLAQEEPADESTPQTTFISRLAANLGLDEATVQDAVQQTVRETRDEHMKQRLDTLVEAGRLTQGEADEIYTWFQDRPDTLLGHGPQSFKGPRHGHFGGRMMGPRHTPDSTTEAPTSFAGPGPGLMGLGPWN